ncbi:MAG: bifunctional phosphoribosylaminoimidazolecarboxamide formyltransferase/IMP cyclohydrolase [Candidatus Caenarcaniphilales bacterium]|nr:bifunctional phosphoribosylaminoimidazolecarboxamide formyltransferase/IMP cyclohydrolase [Candidatus Caenarcaniphilales bacterium]
MKKKALISVSDKSKLENLLECLADEYEFISSSGTAKFIKEAGYPVIEVSDVTNFPEILSGRVKTLHPKIFGGILYDRNKSEHLDDMDANTILSIDLVVVNLYPFKDVVSKMSEADKKEAAKSLEASSDSNTATLTALDKAIENIDIGGVALIRAAAKNFYHVSVLCEPGQYEDYILSYRENKINPAYRLKLASKAFKHTADYDSAITDFFTADASFEETAPQNLNLNLELAQGLRYGENPHQVAGLYTDANSEYKGLAGARQLHGKELSFNNILDLHSAWSMVKEYEPEIPCAVIVKHNNPCGVAIAPSVSQAFIEALSCDTVSAFGGIVALNNTVDAATANELSQIFLEAVIAPAFSEEALAILTQKKNIRLIEHANSDLKKNNLDIKSVDGAFLVQTTNKELLSQDEIQTVTQKKIDESYWVDLILAWKVVKHCKSNAIVAVQNGKTIGVGVGQSNRVKSVQDALAKFDLDTRGAVLASDAFFPFADNVDLAAQNHIAAIIQPGGSVRDDEVIKACDDLGIAMAFTGIRHFKH